MQMFIKVLHIGCNNVSKRLLLSSFLNTILKCQDGGFMKAFSKFTKGFTGFVLLFCLLVGLTMGSSQSVQAAPEKMVGSAEDHGIKLTIDRFAITDYGQEML